MGYADNVGDFAKNEFEERRVVLLSVERLPRQHVAERVIVKGGGCRVAGRRSLRGDVRVVIPARPHKADTLGRHGLRHRGIAQPAFAAVVRAAVGGDRRVEE